MNVVSTGALLAAAVAEIQSPGVTAWVVSPWPSSVTKAASPWRPAILTRSALYESSNEHEPTWSESDNWSLLSMENELNSVPDSADLFNQDLAWNAARDFEAAAAAVDVNLSQEDHWISSMVDEIHNSFASLDDDHPPLYDSSFEETDTVTNALDVMSNEIALLVRCNEHPEDLLISEGRALPPLTDAEKRDVFQLIRIEGESVRATAFLQNAVSKMFRQHAVPDPVDGVLSLDRKGVASWMSESLKTEEGHVSANDKRVLKMLSEFSSYGSGRLVEEDFQNLYMASIVGIKKNDEIKWTRHLSLRQPCIDAVWRD